MSQMRVALRAGDGRSFHAKSRISDFGDVFSGDRLPEAGPARARLKLSGRVEQRVVATDAAKDALVAQIPVFAGESDLGVGLSRDFVPPRRGFLGPLIFGL